MTKEQEVELNKLLDAEIRYHAATIQTHGQQMIAAKAQQSHPPPAAPPPVAPPPRNPPAAGAPNSALLAALAARGARRSRVPAEVIDALEVEMRQMNDALFAKIASAPALDAKQQEVLVKMSHAQIRSRGGFDALRVSMEDAGVPFTAEQLPRFKPCLRTKRRAKSWPGNRRARRILRN